MCLSPIAIPDTKFATTNINRTTLGGKNYYIKLNKDKIDPYKVHRDYKYMYVPCGHCSQCIAIAQMEMVQRIQMEAMDNTIYMGTLTYNEKTLPRIITSQGFEYRYADHKEAADMIRRLRDNNTFGIPFKYLLVSERGSKRARPHFHILLLFKNSDIGPKYMDKWNFEQTYKWTLLENWKRKTGGTTNNATYVQLCDYIEKWQGRKKRATYDFHYVQPKPGSGVTDAAFYVLKYMLKNSTHEEKIRQALKINYDYKDINDPELNWWEDNSETVKTEGEKTWELIKSKRQYSLGFGLGVDYKKLGKNRTIKQENCNEKIIDYLKEGITRSKREKTEYAYYYCPENLNTFPLANYYKRYDFIYNAKDEEDFYKINPEKYRDRYLNPERLNKSELEKQIADFNKILKLQEMEEVTDEFDELLTF